MVGFKRERPPASLFFFARTTKNRNPKAPCLSFLPQRAVTFHRRFLVATSPSSSQRPETSRRQLLFPGSGDRRDSHSPLRLSLPLTVGLFILFLLLSRSVGPVEHRCVLYLLTHLDCFPRQPFFPATRSPLLLCSGEVVDHPRTAPLSQSSPCVQTPNLFPLPVTAENSASVDCQEFSRRDLLLFSGKHTLTFFSVL